jgi:BlaI family penicillinase repressor
MKESLTKQEWIIMETLWNRHPLFLSEIMESMDGRVNWTKSTYLTYLRKMGVAGYIDFCTVRGSRSYSPLIGREECMIRESRSLLSRMTEDSARLFVTNMIREGSLSSQDRRELKRLIDELGESK